MRTLFALLASLALNAFLAAPALAQSGIQWSGNVTASVERARELGVPIMFWVTQQTEIDDDFADDLKDAQQDAFRDPVVNAITERYFVPCRVARNSRVLAEAEKLGLPTNFGLYIAIISPDGKLLAQIDPAQVATAEDLAERLAAASRAYRQALYEAELKPTLTSPDAKKPALRKAVRTAWKLRMYGADADIVALLSREDLTPQERSRLHQLLAAFGTEPCVRALLDASESDPGAAKALERAEPVALPTLLAALPTSEGAPAPRQLAAYRAAAQIAGLRAPKGDAWWEKASAADREAELRRLTSAAESVHDSWQTREGRYR